MAMLLINPIWAIVHNMTADTFHPILFDEKPLPGPYDKDKPIRHASKGHHTEGFPAREEAIANIRELHVRTPDAKFALKSDIEWDGKGTPSQVCFFTKRELLSSLKTIE